MKTIGMRELLFPGVLMDEIPPALFKEEYGDAIRDQLDDTEEIFFSLVTHEPPTAGDVHELKDADRPNGLSYEYACAEVIRADVGWLVLWVDADLCQEEEE